MGSANGRAYQLTRVGAMGMRARLWEGSTSMAGRSADRRCAGAPSARSRNNSRGAISGGGQWHSKKECRDIGARALRAVFSSNDNWLSLSEAERDEWRGYLDRMLEWLHRFGCTPERNPCSLLLERSGRGADFANEKAP